MKKNLLRILITVVLVIGLVALPVFAASSATITVVNTNGIYATPHGVSVLMPNDDLAAGGFISPSGLDVQVSSSSVIPSMLVNDRTLFASPLDVNSTTPFFYTTGNTPASTMAIVLGNDTLLSGSPPTGYMSTTDTPALEPANNFVSDISGYVDTTVSSYPYIGTNSSNVAGSALVNPVNLPAGLVIGDMVIIVAGTNTNVTFTNWSNGFIEIADGGGHVPNLGVAYKIIDGTEPAAIDVTTSGVTAISYVPWVIKNTCGAPSVSPIVPDTGANPDSPSLTSGFGATGTMYFTAMTRNGTVSPLTPSGYTLVSGVLSGISTFVAYKNVTAASEDPTPWIISGGAYSAVTIAVEGKKTLTNKELAYNTNITGVGALSAELPQTLLSPISNDASPDWTNPGNAYDNNVVTFTNKDVGPFGGLVTADTGFLTLNVTQAVSSRLYFIIEWSAPLGGTPSVNSADIDVYNGAWQNTFNGAISNSATVWQADNYGPFTITKVRIRLNYTVHGGGETLTMRIHEVKTRRDTIDATKTGIMSSEQKVVSRLNSNLLEVQSAIPTTPTNLAWNSDCEIGDPTTNWTAVNSTISRSNVQVKIGSYSMKVLDNTPGGLGNTYVQQILPFNSSYQSQTFTIGAWIWNAATNDQTQYFIVYDGVNYYNGAATPWARNGAWTWQTMTVNFDPGASAFNIFIIINGGGGADVDDYLYADGITVVQAATATQTTATTVPVSAATFGWSIPNNVSAWTFNSYGTLPYATYYKLTVANVETLWYQPTSMILGTVMPNRDSGGLYPSTIIFGNNPSGVTASIGALLSLPPSVVSPTASSPNLIPTVNPSSVVTSGNPGTTFPLYGFFKSLLDEYNAASGKAITMAYFWRLIATILAFMFGTMVLIATRQPLFGLLAYALGFLAPTLWMGGIFDWWVPVFYIMGAVGLTLLISKWSGSSI